jgi:hypothetical protein
MPISFKYLSVIISKKMGEGMDKDVKALSAHFRVERVLAVSKPTPQPSVLDEVQETLEPKEPNVYTETAKEVMNYPIKVDVWKPVRQYFSRSSKRMKILQRISEVDAHDSPRRHIN